MHVIIFILIAETLGMEGSVERRGSLYIPAGQDSTDHHIGTRSPSPELKRSVSPQPQK